MQLGHCYSDVRDDHTHKLHVSCDQPHDIEVFHISEFTDATRPTNEVMAATADEQCAAAFETYVGIPADQSTFSIGPPLSRRGKLEQGVPQPPVFLVQRRWPQADHIRETLPHVTPGHSRAVRLMPGRHILPPGFLLL